MEPAPCSPARVRSEGTQGPTVPAVAELGEPHRETGGRDPYLDATNRRLLRGWQLKEELREIFKLSLTAARRALDDWLVYASRSQLDPFVKLARTIRRYRPSIEATIEWKLTNGIAESNNAVIGRIRSNARGYRDPEAFITMIMLDRAGIGPDLPWAA